MLTRKLTLLVMGTAALVSAAFMSKLAFSAGTTNLGLSMPAKVSTSIARASTSSRGQQKVIRPQIS